MKCYYDKTKLSEPHKCFISGMEYVITNVLNEDIVDAQNRNSLGTLKKSVVDETVDVIKKQLYIEICRLCTEFEKQDVGMEVKTNDNN